LRGRAEMLVAQGCPAHDRNSRPELYATVLLLSMGWGVSAQAGLRFMNGPQILKHGSFLDPVPITRRQSVHATKNPRHGLRTTKNERKKKMTRKVKSETCLASRTRSQAHPTARAATERDSRPFRARASRARAAAAPHQQGGSEWRRKKVRDGLRIFPQGAGQQHRRARWVRPRLPPSFSICGVISRRLAGSWGIQRCFLVIHVRFRRCFCLSSLVAVPSSAGKVSGISGRLICRLCWVEVGGTLLAGTLLALGTWYLQLGILLCTMRFGFQNLGRLIDGA
jgi:hypothetical protein